MKQLNPHNYDIHDYLIISEWLLPRLLEFTEHALSREGVTYASELLQYLEYAMEQLEIIAQSNNQEGPL